MRRKLKRLENEVWKSEETNQEKFWELEEKLKEEEESRRKVEKEVEELKKIMLIMRAEGEEKDKEIMELKTINESLQEGKEVLFIDEFDKEMRHFESQMQKVKAGWEEKKKTMEKKNMQWKFTINSESKLDGEYEGEVKGGVPHGLGKWKRDGGYNKTVEGEWEDGLLNGRVVENYYGGRE